MMTTKEERKAGMLKALLYFPHGATPAEMKAYVGTASHVHESGRALMTEGKVKNYKDGNYFVWSLS